MPTIERKKPLRRSQKPLKRTKLRKESKDTTAKTKKRIQALLRELVTKRDGGCVLRKYMTTGACSGPLQAEHLISRSNSISFGDERNIICLCQRHHIFWKPQHSRLYWELIEKIIGEKRWKWLKRVEADTKPHRMTLWDWQKIELELTQQIKS